MLAPWFAPGPPILKASESDVGTGAVRRGWFYDNEVAMGPEQAAQVTQRLVEIRCGVENMSCDNQIITCSLISLVRWSVLDIKKFERHSIVICRKLLSTCIKISM
ncbi:hypothetical protein RRF57_000085 [Xylaria bambusicola]|uniref:Uncharacterized protein n=1 Tax=Xylaria bambusicola TaxID=326684 RepID=A0AAN7U976_9PEZI